MKPTAQTACSLLLGLVTLLCSPSVCHSKKLVILTVELPPYGFYMEGKPTGFNYELGNAIAKEAGFEPINTIAPLARAVQDIAAGTGDMIIMLPTPSILQWTNNLGPFPSSYTVAIGLSRSNPRSFDDIKHTTIGVVRGARYDERLSEENDINIYYTANYSQSLKMLIDKRLDYIVGPAFGIFFTAKQDGIRRDELGTPLVLSKAQAHLLLSKRYSSEDVMQRLSAARKRLIDDGTYKRLRAQYSY